jgi:hypothetical protein
MIGNNMTERKKGAIILIPDNKKPVFNSKIITLALA